MKKITFLEEKFKEIEKISADEILSVTKILVSESSGEFNTLRKDFFENEDVITKIMFLAKKHESDDKILNNIISTLGFSATMYKINNEEIFNLFKKNINHSSNKIKISVARFIHKLPQFDNYDGKWDYIISMPKIPPKKSSGLFFFHAIKKNFDKIPDEYREKIINNLNSHIEKNNLVEDTRNKYLSLIEKIQN
ncbi:hypothetical protein [Aquimarina sp. AD1]|uniref:hypothetical protein n=1 Tax=Aquimarina sp. (strain AD1) TaxID=1714848 RepID=UPI0011C483D5|nr:hypothetical protein [Aquimarina sp. AD1]